MFYPRPLKRRGYEGQIKRSTTMKTQFTVKEIKTMLNAIIHTEEKGALQLDKAIQKNSDTCLNVLSDIQQLSG